METGWVHSPLMRADKPPLQKGDGKVNMVKLLPRILAVT